MQSICTPRPYYHQGLHLILDRLGSQIAFLDRLGSQIASIFREPTIIKIISDFRRHYTSVTLQGSPPGALPNSWITSDLTDHWPYPSAPKLGCFNTSLPTRTLWLCALFCSTADGQPATGSNTCNYFADTDHVTLESGV